MNNRTIAVRPRTSLAATIAITAIATVAAAQQPRLVRDINAISRVDASSHPASFLEHRGILYFAAYRPDVGVEPWIRRSDGATLPLADLAPGAASSDPREFVAVGDVVYFAAGDPRHGTELWRTDGTASGTAQVADIAAGANGSNPRSLLAHDGRVWFLADDGVHGEELWVSDGTATGTHLVADVRPGSAGSRPRLHRTIYKDRVWFTADDGIHSLEMWSTDGTDGGTAMLKDIDTAFSSAPNQLVVLGDTLYFVAIQANPVITGRELWRTDGTAAGTRIAVDVWPGQNDADIEELTAMNGRLYFRGGLPPWGTELFVSDGTPAGTRLVKDINPGQGFGSYPTYLTVLGNKLLFQAWNWESGIELWASDGSAAGTVQLADLNPARNSTPRDLVRSGNLVFFVADGPAGLELFASDGTTAGTRQVLDLRPGSAGSDPTNMTPISGGRIAFSAHEPMHGREPRVSDGTAAGTLLVADVHPAAGSETFSAEVAGITEGLGLTWFVADDGIHGEEIWVSDGTAAGTRMLADIQPGSAGSARFMTIEQERPFVVAGELVYFVVDDGVHGKELWASDGTTAGTRLVADLYPGASTSRPDELAAVGDRLFFQAYTPDHGTELVVTRGSADTTQVLEIAPGQFAGGSPNGIVDFHGIAVFTAHDPAHGFELWRSDGTTGGTKLVADIAPGTGNGEPRALFVHGGHLWFSADDRVFGREPWISDGTAAGTRMIADLRLNLLPSDPTGFTAVGDGVVFAATDLFAQRTGPGRELFRTDGTAAGTSLLLDIRPGTASSDPRDLTPGPAGTAWFTADDGNGRELWRTDGTAQGTRLFADIAPQDGSDPAELIAVDDKVWFRATVGGAAGAGTELWMASGSGAARVFDLVAGGGSSTPQDLTLARGRLVFSADDGGFGRELWIVDRPGASAQRIGAPCGPSAATLGAGAPRLGTTLTIHGERVPLGTWARFTLAGASRGVPIGSLGCLQYVDPSAVALLDAAIGHQPWQVSVALPDDPSIRGVALMAQTFYLTASGGIEATHGLHLQLDR